MRVLWNGPLQFSSTHKIFVSLDLPIVSKLYVLQADKDKAIPDIEQYKLNLSNLDNTPANSLAQARAVRESELLNSSARSAHRELKKVLRQKWKAAQDQENQENGVPKQERKRPAYGYVVSPKDEYPKLDLGKPNNSVKEISDMLAEKWKSITEEERAGYKEIGKTQFQHKAEKWNKALEQIRAVLRLHNHKHLLFLEWTNMQWCWLRNTHIMNTAIDSLALFIFIFQLSFQIVKN